MAESTIGLYKTELISRQGPWRTPEQVEFATLEYIDFPLALVLGHAPARVLRARRHAAGARAGLAIA